MRLCSVKNCREKYKARGMCSRHYEQERLNAAPTCSVQGCNRRAEKTTLRLCGAHYFRWRMHGNTLGGRCQNGAAESFLTSFNPETTDVCIAWPFGKDTSNGYGVKVGGKFPHQIVCTKFHGPKPSRLHEVAHSCGNRICINPPHVRWATHLENVRDSKAHGTMIKGERVGSAKLTATNVALIRCSKIGSTSLAKQFSVRPGTINAVRARRTWRHLP